MDAQVGVHVDAHVATGQATLLHQSGHCGTLPVQFQEHLNPGPFLIKFLLSPGSILQHLVNACCQLVLRLRHVEAGQWHLGWLWGH